MHNTFFPNTLSMHSRSCSATRLASGCGSTDDPGRSDYIPKDRSPKRIKKGKQKRRTPQPQKRSPTPRERARRARLSEDEEEDEDERDEDGGQLEDDEGEREEGRA